MVGWLVGWLVRLAGWADNLQGWQVGLLDCPFSAGLAINRVLEREEAARAAGIRAVILAPQADADRAPQVRLEGRGPLPEAIIVQLTHPVHAQEDRRFELFIQPDGSYRLPTAPQIDDKAAHDQRSGTPTVAAHSSGPRAIRPAHWPASGQWNLSVETPQWRLAGQHIGLRPGMTLTLPPVPMQAPAIWASSEFSPAKERKNDAVCNCLSITADGASMGCVYSS
jgi:hypothetical protein